MYALMLYSLKAGACLAVFYLYFKLLLSRETFHRLNRFVVLGAVALAFVLPLCVITVYREMPVLPDVPVFDAASPQTMAVAAEPFPWETLLGALFLAGAAAMLARTLWSTWCVVRVVRSGRRERLDDGAVLVRVPHEVTPFSWGRYIVISDEDMAVSGREIVLHEREHLRLHHSLDLLVMDLAGCLQWFNPAMWLLRRELRAIHEYEADAAVIGSGVDARAYQLLLIRKAVGRRWYSVANSFNHSKLKNRITMMLCKRSSRWAGAKTLLVLPLAGLALGAFAETAYVFPEDKVTKENVSISVFGPNISVEGVKGEPLMLVDGVEVKSIDKIDPARIASINVRKDAAAQAEYGEKAKNGVVLVTLRKESEKAPALTDTTKIDDVTVVAFSTPDTRKEGASDAPLYTLSMNRSAKPTGHVLYVVDGKVVPSAEGIHPERIRNMTVRKDPSAHKQAARYGNYDAVIEITTSTEPVQTADHIERASAEGIQAAEDGLKSAEAGLEASRAGIEATRAQMSASDWKKNMQQIEQAKRQIADARRQLEDARRQVAEARQQAHEAEAVSQELRTAGRIVSVRQNGSGDASRKIVVRSESGTPEREPLILIDGRKGEMDEMKRMSPDGIASIQVYKSGDAVEIYGDKGKDGVILVTTKTAAAKESGAGASGATVKSDDSSVTVVKGKVTLRGVPDAALYIVNGKSVSKAKVARIAPKKIRKMEVFKGNEAVKRYGEKGRNGVVVIRARK